MKYIFLLIALLQLSGCSTTGISNREQVPPAVETVASPVPNQTPLVGSGEITLKPVEYYTTVAERAVIAKAQIKLNEVVHSKCFNDFISNRKMIQTNGKDSVAVAAHLKAITGVVPVKMYFRRFTSAVAYRQPPSQEINLNRNYFYTTLPLCQWVSTIGHESLGHSLGEYDHSFDWTPERDFSVPYSINKAIDACCKE